jgi:hypothetical protein
MKRANRIRGITANKKTDPLSRELRLENKPVLEGHTLTLPAFIPE